MAARPLRTPARDPRTALGPTIIISSRAGEATIWITTPPSPSPRPTALTTTSSSTAWSTTTPPSDLVPGAREAVITLPAASLSQAITTIRAVAAPLGVLHGLEIVPTAAWDRRLGRTTNEDDLIGVTEAAGALGVTPQAVRERLAAGTLPGRKIGRNWALPASALHR